MARCYICGRYIEKYERSYRRDVYIGSSRWSSYGYWFRPGYRFGSSSRTGIRTLCEECAIQYDKDQRTKKIIFLIFLIFFWGFIIRTCFWNSEKKSISETKAKSSYLYKIEYQNIINNNIDNHKLVFIRLP